MASNTTTTTTNTAAPMPVVTCGAHEAVGKAVIAGLKPEYEVILFCQGATALAKELPLLLSSPATFTPESSTIGSGNFSSPPRAVIFGGAWGPEDIAQVQGALAAAAASGGGGGGGGAEATTIGQLLDELVILRNDTGIKPAPVTQPDGTVVPVVPGSPEYSEHVTGRVRAALGKLASEGKGALAKVEGSNGVYWY
ncbi:uncharacterized protein B0I36DRAFT_382939 [Microdochium trichocladiopsis]|uniref:Uncharacterized protein n=1 Tax=Microdochium trichocladiopsis TaxID=1682393 RepID=A0A9P8Y947_9PEZI|nr:uncharacterized protein B0I36DRAFT_382939 [Microdochium trichocladiopsis]KAH7032976.1 hypothetical protein B0I36DRAFT_382939 [Microdochium trichocladiopsis]